MNYYNEIKNKLIDNKVYKQVKDNSKNNNDLSTYYEVGRLLIEAQGGEKRAKYGDNLIKEYSVKLSKELNKRYSVTLLKNCRQFYRVIQNSPTMSDTLSWSHYIEIIWLNNNFEIEYYIMITANQNLSVRQLRERIKSKEYERLSEDTKLIMLN